MTQLKIFLIFTFYRVFYFKRFFVYKKRIGNRVEIFKTSMKYKNHKFKIADPLCVIRL